MNTRTRLALAASLLLLACGGPSRDDAAVEFDAAEFDAADSVASPEASVGDASDAPIADVPAIDARDAGVLPGRDATADVPFARDVPAPPPDVAPDAGSSLLTAVYDTPEVRVAIRTTVPTSTPPITDTTSVAPPTSCFYYAAGPEIRANIYLCDGCSSAFIPRLATPTRHDLGDPDLLWRTLATSNVLVSDLRVERGPAYTAGVSRQNFHVQFRTSSAGVSYGGIPGTSADPDYADIWMLGCPVTP